MHYSLVYQLLISFIDESHKKTLQFFLYYFFIKAAKIYKTPIVETLKVLKVFQVYFK